MRSRHVPVPSIGRAIFQKVIDSIRTIFGEQEPFVKERAREIEQLLCLSDKKSYRQLQRWRNAYVKQLELMGKFWKLFPNVADMESHRAEHEGEKKEVLLEDMSLEDFYVIEHSRIIFLQSGMALEVPWFSRAMQYARIAILHGIQAYCLALIEPLTPGVNSNTASHLKTTASEASEAAVLNSKHAEYFVSRRMAKFAKSLKRHMLSFQSVADEHVSDRWLRDSLLHSGLISFVEDTIKEVIDFDTSFGLLCDVCTTSMEGLEEMSNEIYQYFYEKEKKDKQVDVVTEIAETAAGEKKEENGVEAEGDVIEEKQVQENNDGPKCPENTEKEDIGTSAVQD